MDEAFSCGGAIIVALIIVCIIYASITLGNHFDEQVKEAESACIKRGGQWKVTGWNGTDGKVYSCIGEDGNLR